MSLYRLEQTGDVDELTWLLGDSDSSAVRARAAEALGRLDVDTKVVDALVTAVQDDEDPTVQMAAIEALDEQGQEALERLFSGLSGADVSPDGAEWKRARAFTGALDDDRPKVRMAAVSVLGSLGHHQAIDALVARLDDEHWQVRERTAAACGDIGDPAATDALVALLAEDRTPVRRAAAAALGTIGGAKALDALTAALAEDDDETVRWTAADALGGFGRADPVGPLVDALSDDAEVVRRAAVFSVVELLGEVPAERSHEVRESVATQSASADEAVIDPLLFLLDRSSQVATRRNGTWLLGRVAGPDDEAALDALVARLDDDDRMTTQFAATSLTAIGGDTVEEALLDFLESGGSENGRAMAAFALGKVGTGQAREYLDALVDTTESDAVRRRAFGALSKLGGRT